MAEDGDPARRCQAVASDGAVANVARVRRGTTTFGLTQSDLAYAAFRGEGNFPATGVDAIRNMRALDAAYARINTSGARGRITERTTTQNTTATAAQLNSGVFDLSANIFSMRVSGCLVQLKIAREAPRLLGFAI